jgi:hypothetical protein
MVEENSGHFVEIPLANEEREVGWKAEAGMCLKIQSPWPMPDKTGRISKMLLDENDPYRKYLLRYPIVKD